MDNKELFGDGDYQILKPLEKMKLEEVSSHFDRDIYVSYDENGEMIVAVPKTEEEKAEAIIETPLVNGGLVKEVQPEISKALVVESVDKFELLEEVAKEVIDNG